MAGWGDMPDGDEPGPPGGRAAAALPQREGGTAEHRPGRARGRLRLPAVRRRFRRDDRRAARACGVRPAGRAAVAAERAGRAEVRPGATGAGHAAGRDREAVDGAGARAGRGGVRRCLGPDRGGVAGAGGPHVPLGLCGLRGSGAVHAAGGAVLDPAGRACRRPGGTADRADPPDQRPGRAAGGEGADRRAGERAGQARHLHQDGRRRPGAPRRYGAGGGVPGGAGRGEDAQRAGQGTEGDRAGGGRAGPLPAPGLLLALLPADARPAAGRASSAAATAPTGR